MALSRNQFIQSVSGNKNFSVSVPYLSKDHIKVAVNGVDVTFTWLNSSTVQLTTAPAVGAVVDIRRETERTKLLVNFQDASTITEEQLDLSAAQTFYIAQEAFDATGGTMAQASDGSYSAQNRRISQLGTPNSDDDAANVGWVKSQYNSGYDAHTERVAAESAATASANSATSSASSATSANNSKTAAANSATAAANSATAAANSATAAANSATAAANSATSANAAKTDVANNAAAAQTAANNAKTSETNALSSSNSASANATSAGNSAAKASQWAEFPEDSMVETGKYSAKHHATKAAASAATAQTAATTAQGYRDTALTHKNDAAASAATATTKASEAATSASTAATKATAAANSAAQAAGYAASLNFPSAVGNGGKLLKMKTDESGFEYASQGSGGGLDVDKVDGYHVNTTGTSPWGYIPLVKSDGVMEVGKYIDFHLYSGDGADYNPRLEAVNSTTLNVGGYKIWHAGNDGSDSGLDADTLDGRQASEFVQVVPITNESTDTARWLKIGTLSNCREGYKALFRFLTSQGYNASPYQQALIELQVNGSWGGQDTSHFASGVALAYGYNLGITQFNLVETVKGTYDIYVCQTTHMKGSYEVILYGTSWTPSEAVQNPSGNTKVVDVRKVFFEGSGGVAILTGTISNGGTIPLPSGYSESECRWMVSINDSNSAGSTWDLREGVTVNQYYQRCYTSGRVVTAITVVQEDATDSSETHAATANYIVIGVK